MRKCVLYLLCCCITHTAFGQADSTRAWEQFLNAQASLQQGKFDSAIQYSQQALSYARNHQKDLAAASALISAQAYQESDQIANALKSYLEALHLYEDLGEGEMMAIVYQNLGFFYQEEGAAEKAIENYLQAVDIQDFIEDTLGLIESYYQLGKVYEENQNDTAALPYYGEWLKLLTAQQDTPGIIRGHRKLVEVYGKLLRPNDALRHNQVLLKLYDELGDPYGQATTLNNIGYAYSMLKDYPAALINFEKAYLLDQNRDASGKLLAGDLINMGVALHNMDRPEAALEKLVEAVRLQENTHQPREQARLSNLMANVYLQMRDFHNADVYAQRALQLAEAGNAADIRADAYYTLSEIKRGQNDFEESLDYSREFYRLRDSLSTEDRIQQETRAQRQLTIERTERELRLLLADQELQEANIKKFQAENEQLILSREKQLREVELLRRDSALRNSEFRQRQLEQIKIQQELEAARRNQQIAYLEQEGKLKNLTLDRQRIEESRSRQEIENLNKERQIQDLQLREERQQGYFLSVLVGFSAILLIFILFGFWQSKKANRQLSRQKTEIEESHRELAETLEQLKSTQAQLVESEKMASLGQLTAGIAHEINNPVNFVSAGINTLRRNLQDLREVWNKVEEINPENAEEKIAEIQALKEEIEYDEALEEVEELSGSIQRGANRTTEIVKGLRIFSRLDESELKPSDIHEHLDSTLVMLRNQYKKRIEIKKDYGQLPEIYGYPGRLNQVFMNLMMNAIQAIDGKGEIRLSTRSDANQVYISIQDSGKGMPEEVKNRIFEPFFTTKQVGEGTGLGLSISLGIIQDHHGTVQVESEPGKGTTFHISLPIKPDPHG